MTKNEKPNRLRQLRLARGWPQIQLAEKCGIGPSRISSLERWPRLSVGRATAQKLADALGADIGDVFPKFAEE